MQNETITDQEIDRSTYLENIVSISDKKTVITDGPLSAQYTKALAEIYKKETDPESGYSLESQQIDEKNNNEIVSTVFDLNEELKSNGYNTNIIYSLDKDNILPDTIVNFSEVSSEFSNDTGAMKVVHVPDEIDKHSDIYMDKISELAEQKGFVVTVGMENLIKHIKSYLK